MPDLRAIFHCRCKGTQNLAKSAITQLPFNNKTIKSKANQMCFYIKMRNYE